MKRTRHGQTLAAVLSLLLSTCFSPAGGDLAPVPDNSSLIGTWQQTSLAIANCTNPSNNMAEALCSTGCFCHVITISKGSLVTVTQSGNNTGGGNIKPVASGATILVKPGEIRFQYPTYGYELIFTYTMTSSTLTLTDFFCNDGGKGTYKFVKV